jgi:plastocyanin
MVKQHLPLIAVVVLLVASLGAGPLSTVFLTVPLAHAATDSVYLQGNFQAWNFSQTVHNPMITVHAGDTVSILLQSRDSMTHQFLLDADGDGGSITSNCPSVDPCSNMFGGTGLPSQITYSFQVNLAPANYTYYCAIHFTSMLGIFRVLPGFSIGASPTSATVVAGGSVNSTISLTSMGFTGTVGLTASIPPTATGVTAAFFPSSVPLSSGSTGTSTLKVSTTTSSPSASFPITITGTSGQLSQTTTFTVGITGGTIGGSITQSWHYMIPAFLGLAACLGVAAAVLIVHRRRNR